MWEIHKSLSIHANIGKKVFVIDEGELDVLFYSLRKINIG